MFLFGLPWLVAGLKPWKGWSSSSSSESGPLYSDSGSGLCGRGKGCGESARAGLGSGMAGVVVVTIPGGGDGLKTLGLRPDGEFSSFVVRGCVISGSAVPILAGF